MRTITFRQVAAIKRVAQNVNSLIQKRNKLAEKINALNKEYNDLLTEIESYEVGVVNLTGYPSEALVTRVVNANKATKWEIRPEALQYDAEKKVYTVILDQDIPFTEVNPAEIDATEERDLFPQEIMDSIAVEAEQQMQEAHE